MLLIYLWKYETITETKKGNWSSSFSLNKENHIMSASGKQKEKKGKKSNMHWFWAILKKMWGDVWEKPNKIHLYSSGNQFAFMTEKLTL